MISFVYWVLALIFTAVSALVWIGVGAGSQSKEVSGAGIGILFGIGLLLCFSGLLFAFLAGAH